MSKFSSVTLDPVNSFKVVRIIREWTVLIESSPKCFFVIKANSYNFQFLAGLGELVEDTDIFSYHEVPHFPISTAPGKPEPLLDYFK